MHRGAEFLHATLCLSLSPVDLGPMDSKKKFSSSHYESRLDFHIPWIREIKNVFQKWIKKWNISKEPACCVGSDARNTGQNSCLCRPVSPDEIWQAWSEKRNFCLHTSISSLAPITLQFYPICSINHVLKFPLLYRYLHKKKGRWKVLAHCSQHNIHARTIVYENIITLSLEVFCW